MIYLPDYAQEVLIPVPAETSPERTPQTVDGTMLGRAYASTTILQSSTEEPGRLRVWMPMLDGTDRVGAMELTLPCDESEIPRFELAAWERFAHLSSQIILVKNFYGDDLQRLRRLRPMSIAAELIWRLLPPLTFATDDVVISGLVEPAYEIGGDAFDYAVELLGRAHRGLRCDGPRADRGRPHELRAVGLPEHPHPRGVAEDATRTMHESISETFGGERYATALLVELDVAAGGSVG